MQVLRQCSEASSGRCHFSTALILSRLYTVYGCTYLPPWPYYLYFFYSNIDELSGTVRREREACLKFSKASKLDPLCQLRLSNYYSYVSSHLKDR